MKTDPEPVAPAREAPSGAEDDREQPLIAHLVELRQRLLRAVLGVLAVALLLLPVANRLYGWLAQPVLMHLPGGRMIATNPISPFFAPLKLALVTALVVAAPFVLYQLWAFVAPGLYRSERRLALPLLVSAIGLFYLGCAFAYFLVLPAVFQLMAAIVPAGVEQMTDISQYLDFVLVVFVAFGLAFEVPVATVIVVLLGIADVAALRAARGYVIVGAFVVAAVITPPDVVSQLMLAIPMCLLYECGIGVAVLLGRRDRPGPSARSGS